MKSKTLGFSTMEGLLALFVIGLMCFSGWYVYDHRKSADANYKKAANPGAVLTTPNSKNSSLRTIKLPEFGVKFSVPVTLKDLTYKVIPVDYSGGGINPLGTYPTAFFSTKQLDTAENGLCDIKSASASSVAPLGYLTRATGQYTSDVSPPPGAIVKYPADSSNPTGTLIKQFPEFFLAFRSSDKACFNLAADNDSAASLTGQLSAALKSVSLSQ